MEIVLEYIILHWFVVHPWARAEKECQQREAQGVRREKVGYLCKGGATNTDDKYALSMCYHGCFEEVV